MGLARKPTFRGTLAEPRDRLGHFDGAVAGPQTSHPFQLVPLENVAYLATPARRRRAFAPLRAGRHARLTPDSNRLGLLVRLDLVTEQACYARTYAEAQAVAGPKGVAAAQRAHLLLQHHGQTPRKRRQLRCPGCPLRQRCTYARAESTSARREKRPAPQGRKRS
jgi:hypothetical protein